MKSRFFSMSSRRSHSKQKGVNSSIQVVAARVSKSLSMQREQWDPLVMFAPAKIRRNEHRLDRAIGR